MEIKEFTRKIQQKVGTKLGPGYQVKIQEVRKNNNVCLHGILILSKQQNVSPTIYLDQFLEAYRRGITLSEITSKIIEIYRKDTPGRNVDMEFFKNFEKVKDRICYRLISAEKNRRLLEEIPSVPFLDLAISFYYAYQGKDLGNGTILIHNSHLEMWHTSVAELMQLAQQNTLRLFPWECKSMEEIMLEYQEQEQLNQEEGQEEFFGEMPMVILSNSQRTHGAACILYPGLLEELAAQAGADLYILPSSIHEVILLSDTKADDPGLLREMVKEVNMSQVGPEEVLSNQIYYYDRTEKNVKIIF